ncbi:MAG: hypothetical protein QOD03_876 [Verrucomicrobiota bacterium]|jgi:multisubunit Na+/H+ antiporter MnhB subunit
MSPRVFKIVCSAGGVNLLLYLACYGSLKNNPGSGPEGIGTALFAMCCLAFSALLGAFGMNQLYSEFHRKAVSKRSILATLIAESPLLFYLLFDVLPRRFSH